MCGKILYLLFGIVAHHVENEVSATPLSPNNSQTCARADQYLDVDLNKCCKMCAPGTRLKIKCSNETDPVCEPCQPGFYSEKMNYYPNCFRCPLCREDRGLQYARECTASSPAVCVCKEGMFCTLRGHDHQCKECRRYAHCAPGYGVAQAGTADSDVRCMRCPVGTFSDMTSYTQICQRHTECSTQGRDVVQLGDAESDTRCGPVVRPPPTRDPGTTYASIAVTHTPSITHYAESSTTIGTETISRSHITNPQSIPGLVVPVSLVLAVTVPAAVALLISIAWMLCKKRVGTSRDGMPTFCEYKGLSQQKGGPSSILKCHLLGHAQPGSSLSHALGQALLEPQCSTVGEKSLTSSSVSQFPDSCGGGHSLVVSRQTTAST